VASTHIVESTPETVRSGYLDPAAKPVATVVPGDTVRYPNPTVRRTCAVDLLADHSRATGSWCNCDPGTVRGQCDPGHAQEITAVGPGVRIVLTGLSFY
jgi:hypothetical protein